MRLIDLHPEWVGNGGRGVTDKDGNPVPRRDGVGIRFDCPCGRCDPERNGVFVHVDPPLDGKPFDTRGIPQWKRTGDDFATMTLEPSILRVGGCGWHGFVRNGEVTNA